MSPRYPDTRRVDTAENYHGTLVADPYRWLESPADDPEVRAWIDAQNALTEAWLEPRPARRRFRQRLTELWNHPKRRAPFARGGRLFQFRNAGLQNQDVLYLLGQHGEEDRALLDPNQLATEGTTALTGYSVSRDGQTLAYALSRGGSDWKTWHFRDVETGRNHPDRLPWCKFSGATWLPDSSGILYLRYPEPDAEETFTAANRAPVLMLHLLGSSPREDVPIYSRPNDPDLLFAPVISHDGSLLVVHLQRGTDPATLVLVRSLESAPLTGGNGAESEDGFRILVGDWSGEYAFLGNDGERLYFRTEGDLGRGRIDSVSLEHTDLWRTVLPESDDILLSANLQRDTFVTVHQHHASHRLHRFDLAGRHLGEIPLPALGTIEEVHAERDREDLYFSFSSFLRPLSPYRLGLAESTPEPLWAPPLAFDPEAFDVEQRFVASPDGTRIPLFLIHPGGDPAERPRPTLLYGYGGFNVSLTPTFSVSRLAWLEQGGVLAVANLRGGGEYGRAWHDDGRLGCKQNVFDDFIACAEHLIAEGITTPNRLGIQGGSNGGLLVAACMVQRPELFGAVHASVGVLDMLRFHRFTIGWAWTSDYGSAEDPEQFRTLLAYSPLHNLEPGTCYPATLVTTGDRDDRVVPAHSFKFTAALQEVQGGEAPILLRTQTQSGHGLGKPTRMVIDEQADVWTFLTASLGLEESR